MKSVLGEKFLGEKDGYNFITWEHTQLYISCMGARVQYIEYRSIVFRGARVGCLFTLEVCGCNLMRE